MNWNNRHWSALQQCGRNGPWLRTDSIESGGLHGGRACIEHPLQLCELLTGIQAAHGRCSLHGIKRCPEGAGVHFLETEGMRAHLPAEVSLLPDVAGSAVESLERTVGVVTANVGGLGDYRISSADRIAAIIDKVTLFAPDAILLQEVTVDSTRWRRRL